jgi:hypothetical protein
VASRSSTPSLAVPTTTPASSSSAPPTSCPAAGSGSSRSGRGSSAKAVAGTTSARCDSGTANCGTYSQRSVRCRRRRRVLRRAACQAPLPVAHRSTTQRGNPRRPGNRRHRNPQGAGSACPAPSLSRLHRHPGRRPLPLAPGKTPDSRSHDPQPQRHPISAVAARGPCPGCFTRRECAGGPLFTQHPRRARGVRGR